MKQLLQSFFYLLPRFFSGRNSLIFLNHIKLILNSFISYRFKRGGADEEKVMEILGHSISFFSYPVLINQFEEIFIYKSYAFKNTLEGPLIFDCGSNIGISVLYFKFFYPGSTLVAFEPDPDNFRLLKKNIEFNSFKNVTLHNYALGQQEGSCKLFNTQSGKGSLTTSIYANKPDAGFINVPMKKLSSFIHQEIDFMKIDVEGAEGEIIYELLESGKQNSVKELVIEYHEKCNIPEDKLICILMKHGFSLSEKRQLYIEGKETLLRFRRQ